MAKYTSCSLCPLCVHCVSTLWPHYVHKSTLCPHLVFDKHQNAKGFGVAMSFITWPSVRTLATPTQPTIMYTVCTSECTLGTHLQQIAHESPYFSTQLLFTLILHFSVYHLCFSFLLSFALCQATPVALVSQCSLLWSMQQHASHNASLLLWIFVLVFEPVLQFHTCFHCIPCWTVSIQHNYWFNSALLIN